MRYSYYSLVVGWPQIGVYKRQFSSQVVEAASVIKLFIATVYLINLQKQLIPLNSPIMVKAVHVANTQLWARKINWELKLSTASHLISMSIINSDAVATNVLLEQIGGKEELNIILRGLGFGNTVLTRDNFSGSDSKGKKFFVGQTTADDCAALLDQLFVKRKLLSGKYFRFFKNIMSKVQLHTGQSTKVTFCHKTGTVLSGNRLTINDIGVVYQRSSDKIPHIIIVLLTFESFYGKYYGGMFFKRLQRFDEKVIELSSSQPLVISNYHRQYPSTAREF